MRNGARPLHPDLLSAYHASRAGLYRAAFELVRASPKAGGLQLAHDLVSAAARIQPSLVVLEQALAAATARHAGDEWARLLGKASRPAGRCADPSCSARGEAFAAATTAASDERASELGVLAVLAERTTDALASSSLPEAAILADVQSRFLVKHAGACLGELGTSLREGGTPLYSQVGAALRSLIEEDLRLLGYPDAPP